MVRPSIAWDIRRWQIIIAVDTRSRQGRRDTPRGPLDLAKSARYEHGRRLQNNRTCSVIMPAHSLSDLGVMCDTRLSGMRAWARPAI